MNQPVYYKTSSASYDELLDHLRLCDEYHTPKLSERLDIPSYAKKLFENSVTFEAWSENKLIGLIAVYFNNEKQGFISNVSVSGEHMKKGIATMLLQHCIKGAVRKHISSLSLEVSSNNETAITLYEKSGFQNSERQHPGKTIPFITMRLNLKGQPGHE